MFRHCLGLISVCLLLGNIESAQGLEELRKGSLVVEEGVQPFSSFRHRRRTQAEPDLEPESQLRAAWIPSVDYGTGINGHKLNRTDFSFLASLGVNKVYIDVWNNGQVYFNSTTMDRLMNDDGSHSLTGAMGRGTLAENWTWPLGYYASLAAEFGMEAVAWFEYGFMTQYVGNGVEETGRKLPPARNHPGAASINDHEGVTLRPDDFRFRQWILPQLNNFSRVAMEKGWLLGVHNGFLWLDPSNVEVVEFLGNMMADALELGAVHNPSPEAEFPHTAAKDRNGTLPPRVAGVQLDDHFACPSAFAGNCSESIMDSALLHIRRILFRRWGRNQSESFNFQKPAMGPRLELAPGEIHFSREYLNVNWSKWLSWIYIDDDPAGRTHAPAKVEESGIILSADSMWAVPVVDVVVPQLYYEEVDIFNRTFWEEYAFLPSGPNNNCSSVGNCSSGATPRECYDAHNDSFSACPTNLSAMTPIPGFIAGVRLNGSGQPTSWPELEAMLVFLWNGSLPNSTHNTQSTSLSKAHSSSACSVQFPVGASIWYVEGMLEIYRTQFENFWGLN